MVYNVVGVLSDHSQECRTVLLGLLVNHAKDVRLYNINFILLFNCFILYECVCMPTCVYYAFSCGVLDSISFWLI